MPAAVPAKVVRNFYGGLVAPHVATARWSYTVPAGRFCVLENVNMDLIRIVAAAGAVVAQAYISLNPAAGGVALLSYLEVVSNAIGDGGPQTWGSQCRMLAGDNILAVTVDNSVGGLMDYSQNATGTEYDI
jgi:hypothetical protein